MTLYANHIYIICKLMLIKYQQNPIENADKKYLKIIGLDMSKHFCLVIKTF